MELAAARDVYHIFFLPLQSYSLAATGRLRSDGSLVHTYRSGLSFDFSHFTFV